ncbi:hypothetical protein [Kocuria sabuli]|uniref:hypothetical protein n=1 Tax=Kocuria sabuli TaxID=3071448 RepID=UPI0034D3C4A6
MDTPLVTAVARVPIVVRFRDARGRPVSLSGRTLSRASTDLQDLLRLAYRAVRGDVPTETVTVSFLEEDAGRLQLEYLVVDRTPPSRWRRGRDRRRAEGSRAALMQATIVVTAAVEAVGALAAATSARWVDSDSPDFADVVLDGARAVRVPGTVRAWTEDGTTLDLLRGTMSMFADDDVEQLVIGKDPETPGHYQEAVVARSPALLRFLAGGPLASLVSSDPEPA